VRLVEEKFRPILKELEQEVIANDWFDPKTVYGWFPAQSEGNEVIVYDPEGNNGDPDAQGTELLRIDFPRQREGRLLSIADFFSPKSSGRMDVIGFSVVTIGSRASEVTQKLFEAGDFTKYLYLHGLSVETAEALAEYMHVAMRKELGIDGEDAPDVRDLFHPEVPRLALLLRLPGVSQPGRPGEDLLAAEAGGEDQRAPDRGVPH